jgi:hypothetical protein
VIFCPDLTNHSHTVINVFICSILKFSFYPSNSTIFLPLQNFHFVP